MFKTDCGCVLRRARWGSTAITRDGSSCSLEFGHTHRGIALVDSSQAPLLDLVGRKHLVERESHHSLHKQYGVPLLQPDFLHDVDFHIVKSDPIVVCADNDRELQMQIASTRELVAHHHARAPVEALCLAHLS